MREYERCKLMLINFHTHTWRCHHAEGTEREYVEQAIRNGMAILGFSDHAPYPYPEGYVAWNKMLPSELEGYVDTVLDLRREYRGQIDIRLGLEAEYYPALWEDFLRMLEPYPIEYLLLGQHFLDNEYEDPVYNGEPTDSADRLRRYCAQTIEGLKTGKFMYLAHPDLIHFTGDRTLYEEEMTGLCRFCRRNDIPIEVNLLGVRDARHYPDGQFWRIAAREGNRVLLGADAHRAGDVCRPDADEKAFRFMERCGIPGDRIVEIP